MDFIIKKLINCFAIKFKLRLVSAKTLKLPTREIFVQSCIPDATRWFFHVSRRLARHACPLSKASSSIALELALALLGPGRVCALAHVLPLMALPRALEALHVTAAASLVANDALGLPISSPCRGVSSRGLGLAQPRESLSCRCLPQLAHNLALNYSQLWLWLCLGDAANAFVDCRSANMPVLVRARPVCELVRGIAVSIAPDSLQSKTPALSRAQMPPATSSRRTVGSTYTVPRRSCPHQHGQGTGRQHDALNDGMVAFSTGPTSYWALTAPAVDAGGVHT